MSSMISRRVGVYTIATRVGTQVLHTLTMVRDIIIRTPPWVNSQIQICLLGHTQNLSPAYLDTHILS